MLGSAGMLGYAMVGGNEIQVSTITVCSDVSSLVVLRLSSWPLSYATDILIQRCSSVNQVSAQCSMPFALVLSLCRRQSLCLCAS